MSSKPLVADDFVAIRARLAELEKEPQPAEAPKAQPDFSGGMWGQPFVPDYDPA